MPDLNSLTLYGIPLIGVITVVLGVLRKYTALSEEILTLVKAAFGVGGYVLIAFLPSVEAWWPAMPQVLPVLLNAFMLFGMLAGVPTSEWVRRAKANAKALFL